MTKVALPLLLLSVLSLAGVAFAATSITASSTTNFIKDKCGATRYIALCVRSLSPYAGKIQQSLWQLTQTAVAVSLERAQSANAFVEKLGKDTRLKPVEIDALHDCMNDIGDSVDRLSKSARELELARQAPNEEFLWRISNVETWVADALTDENTCISGFAGQDLNGWVKAAITARVMNVVQCTSNALALIKQLE